MHLVRVRVRVRVRVQVRVGVRVGVEFMGQGWGSLVVVHQYDVALLPHL